MSHLWLKIKVWTKIILVTLVTIYILLFIINNSDYPATLWLFIKKEHTTSVLWLTMISFIAGAATTLLAKTLISTVSQLKQIKAQKAHEDLKKSVADMQAKAAMLQTKPDAEDK
jgi:hypothetical protein